MRERTLWGTPWPMLAPASMGPLSEEPSPLRGMIAVLGEEYVCGGCRGALFCFDEVIVYEEGNKQLELRRTQPSFVCLAVESRWLLCPAIMIDSFSPSPSPIRHPKQSSNVIQSLNVMGAAWPSRGRGAATSHLLFRDDSGRSAGRSKRPALIMPLLFHGGWPR